MAVVVAAGRLARLAAVRPLPQTSGSVSPWSSVGVCVLEAILCANSAKVALHKLWPGLSFRRLAGYTTLHKDSKFHARIRFPACPYFSKRICCAAWGWLPVS